MANENGQRNLAVEEEAGLVTLTINRPEKRNALSTAMMTELNAELSAIGKRADARADARGRAKACDGNAADGTTSQSAHGGRVGTREPGRAGRRAGRGDPQARDADRRSEPAHHWDWQAGVLRADRSRYGEGVRLRKRSDEPECDGVGRARRHRCISGKANTALARQVSRFNEEQII